MDSGASVESQQSYPHCSTPTWPGHSPSGPVASERASKATSPVSVPDSTLASPLPDVPATATTSPPPAVATADASLDTTAPAPAGAGASGAATAPLPPTPNGSHIHPPVDLIPYSYWLPHQSNVYYAQLLHYNKLVSPNRGGGLQAAPLPPVVSASNAQAGPRSRSSSKVSLKDSASAKGHATGGHGNRTAHTSDKNRNVITPRETPANKMASKKTQPQAQAPESTKPRQATAATSPSHAQTQGISQSSSVPSTPHQRARQFSLGSREPSPPENTTNHSPRSAYSETTTMRPSAPPRIGGCIYETSQINSRRRMAYALGAEQLEKKPLGKIKGSLTEEEEQKLATDMREVYDRLLPSDQVQEKRQKLVQKLESIFNERWPGYEIKAHLFGSSGNLLCSDDSDVDICVTTDCKEMEAVCLIADLLARRGMEKVVCISAAKVPIVKIWDPELGLACDINVNNALAIENTRMIRVYIETDPRVRQLMMIIKHWTRRRIIKDAAFGGTLSSYTWICLVIGFLQLRTPPVLPALHQLPYRMPRPSGGHSEFADNLKKLRGFGNKNKSSEAELLFQFFRFYAHEFDYDKYVLSIRLGKMIPKTDKSWQYAANNKLCVEEPFNTSRNLGNTADEYSFRGLHLELRRAFDLISESKFDEACEQYVFPKEEERVFTRPPNQPRPAMIRSASQTNHGSGRGGGRGGHRGGRHQNNHRGGGGPNRRTSSNIAQDQMYPGTAAMQQDLAWYAPYMAYPQEVLAQLGYLQQESLRQMQMFQSNPMFAQQQQAIGGTQMSGSNSSPGHPNQSSDRSRTNSFDNQPPVNNLYSIYPMAVGSPMFASQAHAAYGAYPTQPNTTPATNGAGQEYRRPSQRSAATTEAASSSALRSQSQPAARSPSTMQPSLSGQHLPISQSFTGTSAVGARSANGVSIPSFMSDDAELDGETQSRPRSPRADDRNTGAVSAAVETEDAAQRQQPTGAGPGSIEFGDLPNAPSSSGATRRRLSTDQTPQTVLDRRMKRTSRSPSPLGHSRAFSAGTGPLASVNGAPRTGSRPVVVNGSSLKTSVSASNRAPPPPPAVESNAPASNGHHHPFYDTDRNGGSQPGTDPFATQPLPATARAPVSEGAPGAYSATDEACFRERVAMLNAQAYANGQFPGQPIPVAANGQPPALQPMPQSMPALPPQNAAVAHLDLAVSRAGLGPSAEADPSVLSPVYENATSPTKPRKAGRQAPQASSGWAGAVKQNLPVDEQMSRSQDMPHRPKNATSPALPPSATNAAPKVSQAREHGHVRGAKSESESGWQRAGKGKKKGLAANNLGGAGTLQGHAEIPPKNTSERKGG